MSCLKYLILVTTSLQQHSSIGDQLTAQHNNIGNQLTTQHTSIGEQLTNQHNDIGKQLTDQHTSIGVREKSKAIIFICWNINWHFSSFYSFFSHTE